MADLPALGPPIAASARELSHGDYTSERQGYQRAPETVLSPCITLVYLEKHR
jgi:hypothetical protein